MAQLLTAELEGPPVASASPSKWITPVAWPAAPASAVAAAPAAAPAWPLAAVRWQDLPDLGGVRGYKADQGSAERAIRAAGYTGPALVRIGQVEAGAANEAGDPSFEPVYGPSPAALAALDAVRFLAYKSGGDSYADIYDRAGRMLLTIRLQDMGSSWADKLVATVVAVGGALVTGGALGLIGGAPGAAAAPAASAEPLAAWSGVAPAAPAAPLITPAAVQASNLASIDAAVAVWSPALPAEVLGTALAPSVTAALAVAAPAAVAASIVSPAAAAAGQVASQAARAAVGAALTTALTPPATPASPWRPSTTASTGAAAAAPGPGIPPALLALGLALLALH